MTGDSEMGEEAAEPVAKATAKLNLIRMTHVCALYPQFTRCSLWHDIARLQLPQQGAGESASLTSPRCRAELRMHHRSNLRNHLSLEKNHLFQL